MPSNLRGPHERETHPRHEHQPHQRHTPDRRRPSVLHPAVLHPTALHRVHPPPSASTPASVAETAVALTSTEGRTGPHGGFTWAETSTRVMSAPRLTSTAAPGGAASITRPRT